MNAFERMNEYIDSIANDKLVADFDTYRIILLTFSLSIISTFSYAILHFFNHTTVLYYSDVILCCSSIFSLFVALKFPQKAQSVMFLFLIFLNLNIAFKHAITPPDNIANIIWFPLFLLAAAITLNKKNAAIVSIVSFFFYFASSIIKTNEYFSAFHIEPGNTSIFNLVSIALVSTTIVGAILFIVNKMKLSKLELKNQIEQTLKNRQNSSILLSLVTHDIANSITVIDGFLKEVDPKDLKKKELNRKFLLKVHNHSEVISKIIRQVREMQKSPSESMSVTLKPTNITTCTQLALSHALEACEKKNISLIFSSSIDKNTHVVAEQNTLINNVIMNLLVNAIKFSFQNSKIDVDLREDENGILLSVKDYGVGIPPEILSNIFHRNRPTSRKGTQGEKGTGLGMPIVKNFIDMYEAKINISTLPQLKEGQGGTTIEVLFKRDSLENNKEIIDLYQKIPIIPA